VHPQEWRKAIVSDRRLSPRARLAALVLAVWMQRDGSCFRAHEDLAADCGWKSKTSAKKAVRELARAGYLRIEWRGFHPHQLPNGYAARLPGGRGTPRETEDVIYEL
jgi:hypothetical protein